MADKLPTLRKGQTKMNNPIKSLLTIAADTLAGIRALPAIHTLAQEATDAAISERAAAHVDVRTRELERKLTEQTKEIETLRDFQVRLDKWQKWGQEISRELGGTAGPLLPVVQGVFASILTDLDASRKRIAENESYQEELNNLVRRVTDGRDAYRDELQKWEAWGNSVCNANGSKTGPVLEEVKRIVAEMTRDKTQSTTQPVVARYTYQIDTEQSGGSVRAIYRRSDGKVTRSSWWGVDDGSAEVEATEKMTLLERAERSELTSEPQPEDDLPDFDPSMCTCFQAPPCGYCTNGEHKAP